MARAQRKPAPSNVVPLRLVSTRTNEADRDTIDCLLSLLFEAQAGKIRGLAYVAIHEDGKQYTINTCGAAYKNPTFTIGTLSVLADDLSERVRAGS